LWIVEKFVNSNSNLNVISYKFILRWEEGILPSSIKRLTIKLFVGQTAFCRQKARGKPVFCLNLPSSSRQNNYFAVSSTFAVSHNKSAVSGSEAITDLGAWATTLSLKLEASIGAAPVGSSAKRM
jgi:hypothetical protein